VFFYGICLIIFIIILLSSRAIFKRVIKKIDFSNLKTLSYMSQNTDQSISRDIIRDNEYDMAAVSNPFLYPGIEKFH